MNAVRVHRSRAGLVSALATLLVLGVSGPALGGALVVNQTAAGVAIPFIVGDGMTTEAVLTNAGGSDITLHFDLIDGDAQGSVPITEAFPSDQGDWETQDFTCKVTARETVQFSFTNTFISKMTC